jgi:hypothetical protein
MLLTVLAAALVGCAGGQGTNTITRTGGDDAESVVTDGRLRSYLRTVDVNEFERGGVLVVQASFENTTKQNQPFTYNFEWYEGSYRLPDAGGVVTRENIEPQGLITLTGTAPNPRVDGYRLNLNRREM